MQRILTCAHDETSPDYPGVRCRAAGDARGSLGRMGKIWAIGGTLGEGAELRWDGAQADEIVFLIEGKLSAGDREVPVGAAILIEAGALACVRALARSKIVHFGPSADDTRTANAKADATVRVVPAEAAQGKVVSAPDGTVYKTCYYADGTAPTCNAALLRVEIDASASVPPHSHSADEIIHVLHGCIKLGERSVTDGMSLYVAGDTRYAFKTEGPIDFVNYRPSVSYITTVANGKKMLETVRGITEGFDA